MQSPVSQEEESGELAQFRQEWLAELRSRKAVAGSDNNDVGLRSPTWQALPENLSIEATIKAPIISATSKPNPQLYQLTAETSSNYVPSAHFASSQLPRTLGSALNVYRRAVHSEQNGDLDNALFLYRQAFRMEPNVDRAYHREEALASIAAVQDSTQRTNNKVDELPTKPQVSLPMMSRASVTVNASSAHVTRPALATILAGFPDELTFEPEDEEEPVHLQKVPDELLVVVLQKLDPGSIERFASVSRKARVIALDSGIWSRPGLSENTWVKVLSLLANEEFSPHQVIPLLKPTLRMKGFFIGTWSLAGTTIQLSDLLSSEGSLPSDNSSRANRYTFVMTLDLMSRPLGRWNKMNIMEYNTVNLETGDVHPVTLKNERAFWFSKVRSYNTY
ncbi:hypothetical protein H0H93_016697 [Arthromyces matolae]|nr:hypothetical protein H0H93_016697 [Arthromyces matolae]